MNLYKVQQYKKEIIYISGIIIFLILNFFPLTKHLESPTQTEAGTIPIEKTFPEVQIVGEAGIVKDLITGEVLYSKNKNEEHPLASLTKIMSSIIASEYLEDETLVTIHSHDILKEGDSGLFENELWKAKELLGLTLVASSNDGTSAIKTTIEKNYQIDLINEMNKKAKLLDLDNTYFLNESGLDVTENIGGSYGSAEDIADLLDYAILNHYDLFNNTNKDYNTFYSVNYGPHTVQNTNLVTQSIPSLLIGKTGFTDLAGGNLAIVFEKEPMHPIAVVVLGSTKNDRFTDVEKLVWATFEY